MLFTLVQCYTPTSILSLLSPSLPPSLSNPMPHNTWILLLVHEPHDVLHEVPSFLRILWCLGLLHQVRDLDLAPREGGKKDAHLLQDGHVLSVAEVQCVDVQPGRSVRLPSRGTVRSEMGKTKEN